MEKDITFYILTEDDIALAFNATTNVTVTYPSKVTKYPVEEFFNSTDHIFRENTVVTMKGRLTDIISPYELYSYEFIEEIERRINAGELFSVNYSQQLRPLQNCAAEKFVITKPNNLATESYEATLQFTQIRVASSADVVLLDDLQVSNQKKKNLGELEQPPSPTEQVCYTYWDRQNRPRNENGVQESESVTKKGLALCLELARTGKEGFFG